MQIFLSWSGERSKALAEAFSGWIRQVIQAVEPWMSSDIEKGSRWTPEVSSKLETSKAGIICLTRENLAERWILFEAGALSKTPDAHVCTLLLDVQPSDVDQPLGQFQHTAITEDDVCRLVRTINQLVQNNNERALSESDLQEVFDAYWPRLLERLEKITAQAPEAGSPKRSDREMLEEILLIIRGQDRRLSLVESGIRSFSTFSGYIPVPHSIEMDKITMMATYKAYRDYLDGLKGASPVEKSEDKTPETRGHGTCLIP